MWGRKTQEPAPSAEAKPDEKPPQRLRDALRQARIESAERTGVIVDMRDADLARLEILNEALEPLFKDVPDDIDLFDRALSRGDQPRLWIDAVAHVDMGRDKRTYRFVQDTRYGRIVLSESLEVPPTVEAITDYVARRIVEREQAIAVPPPPILAPEKKRRFGFWSFVLGILLGAAGLFALALFDALRSM
jgi:hypothetical protein